MRLTENRTITCRAPWAVPRDAALSLIREDGVGWGSVRVLFGREDQVQQVRVEANSAKAGKRRGGHTDTPAAVRGLASSALDLSFPIWKMGLTVEGRWRTSDSTKRPDGGRMPSQARPYHSIQAEMSCGVCLPSLCLSFPIRKKMSHPPDDPSSSSLSFSY